MFVGWLFEYDRFLAAVYAFLVLCCLSSAVYIINDLIDRPRDRLHPFKRLRPIAAGQLNPQTAAFAALLLIFIGSIITWQFQASFVVAIAAFLMLQISYSLFLKKVILLDVMAIAASFIIRVYAGAFIIGAHINVWFLLAVLSLALFLAIGKRRSELTILQGQEFASKHRATLGHYPTSLLDTLTTMFATAAWLTYGLFTFNFPQLPPSEQFRTFLFSYLPATVEQSKWLMATIPLVIYGVMRYLYIIYEKKEGESPERILLSDKPLLTTVMIWGISVLLILYVING